jgi:chemotaxis protein CheY-P-specific phosphatase CheC
VLAATQADHLDWAPQAARESAQALARLLRRSVMVAALDVVDLANVACGHARIGVTLAFETSGGAPGYLAFILDEDVAVRLVAGLTGADDAELGTMALMALAEVGNIAASAYLNGAASVVGRACLPSVPRVSHAPVEQSVRAAMPPGAVRVATLIIDGHDVVTAAFVSA